MFSERGKLGYRIHPNSIFSAKSHRKFRCNWFPFLHVSVYCSRMTKIRFAILGTARIAETVAPKIRTSDSAELVGIASRSEEKAQRFADRFEVPRTYSSYEAALSDPAVDAVYIPLPPSLHLEWTTRAAQAGKHILCEKPLAVDSDECRQMINVCRDNDVVLLDGVMWYHTDRCQRIRELAIDECLGELRHMSSAFTFRWDTMPMDNLRLHRGMGGGSLLDLGWYCVGATLLLFQELPLTVFAQANWHNDVDTRLNAIMTFSGGRTASFECGFDATRRRWFELAGATKTLICRDFTRPFDNARPSFQIVDGEGNAEETVVNHRAQEECMVESFCRLIRERQTNHPWLDLSLKTQTICEAIDRSAREGTIVSLDPNDSE